MANGNEVQITGTAQAERVAAQETIAQRLSGYEKAGIPNPSRPLGETVQVSTVDTSEEAEPVRTTVTTHKKTTAPKPMAAPVTVAPKPIKDGE